MKHTYVRRVICIVVQMQLLLSYLKTIHPTLIASLLENIGEGLSKIGQPLLRWYEVNSHIESAIMSNFPCRFGDATTRAHL